MSERANEKVRTELITFELNAVALLTRAWAEKAAQPNESGFRDSLAADKLSEYRSAIIGGHQDPPLNPDELVLDEYFDVLRALESVPKTEWLSIDPATIMVEYKDEDGTILKRNLPIKDSDAKEILTQKGGVTTKARDIVAKRFESSDDSVYRAAGRKDKYRTSPPSDPQRYLAASFLDIWAFPTNKETQALSARILDTLISSRYNLNRVYYLVRTAHKIMAVRPIPGWHIEQLERVCERLMASDNSMAKRCPFADVVPQ